MSRFMLQLMVESRHEINRLSLHVGQSSVEKIAVRFEKDDNVMKILSAYGSLSPTALNRYLRCPMQFYFNNIAGIREPDEDIEEQLTSRAFGNIFHNVLEEIYKDFAGNGRMITSEVIKKLSETQNIEAVVDRMFQKEMFGSDERLWHKLHYNGMQLISRTVLIKYVKRLLDIDLELTPFSIVALEKDMFMNLDVNTDEGVRKVKVGGRIDRLDMVNDPKTGRQTIRVIDYKTGGSDIKTPVATIGEIFSADEAGGKKHTDYYLQAMLYSMIARNDRKLNPQALPVSPALIFIQRAFGENYDPVISLGRQRINDVEEYQAEFGEGLKALVANIYDRKEAFAPTANLKICTYCPYKPLCGR